MQENTNKAIALNSIILYGKMIITTICALFTTRFALQALGVVDFGLYNVLGGIISFIGIFNTIMVSTSNRFIAVAIGRGDMVEVNKQFNVNFVVHLFIALFALLLAVPIGEWYIPRYLSYDGPILNARIVYYISIMGSVASFIGVPYKGVLMARERFAIFSLSDIFLHVLKLIVAWLLINHFEHKLLIYTTSMSILTAATTFIYIAYCHRFFPDIIRFCKVRDSEMYKSVFHFSSWVSIGAVSQVARDQGASVLVNAFFNTAMNAAMGIASSINVYVTMFANNVVHPVQPQISKSYAAGDYKRANELLIMSTKYSFLLVLLIGSLFIVAPEWLLSIWLYDVPEYASIFLTLFIINNLVNSLNSGVSSIIWANGNIKLYQICVTSLNVISLILGWLVLHTGFPAYYLTLTYILISVFRFFIVQKVLKRTLHFDNAVLWKDSYLPSLLVIVIYIPIIFLMPPTWNPLLRLLISTVYLCGVEWFVGLGRSERLKLIGFMRKCFIKG